MPTPRKKPAAPKSYVAAEDAVCATGGRLAYGDKYTPALPLSVDDQAHIAAGRLVPAAEPNSAPTHASSRPDSGEED